MKKFEKKTFSNLKHLTGIKKAVKAAELEKIRVVLLRMDGEVLGLKSPIKEGSTVEEVRANTVWQVWRQEEILRINNEKAKVYAQYIQASIAAGKSTAEDEVAIYLNKSFKDKELIRKRRKAELANSSHFLSNDISN